MTWALLWALIATWAAWRCRNKRQLPWAVLLAAIAARLLFLGLPPTLSDDVFRYLWEGKVQQAGFNPFIHAPSDPALATLRDSIHAQVAHPNVPTIYPPLAQALFRVSALFYTPLFFQATAMLADLGIVLLLTQRVHLQNRSVWPAVFWALHPLPILESSASGHIETLAIFMTIAAVVCLERKLPTRGALLATAGGLLKLLPFLLVVQALRHPPPRTRARIALACTTFIIVTTLPFLGAGSSLFTGFETYAVHWSHNASVFGLLQWTTGGDGLLARKLGVCLGLAVSIWAWRHRNSPAELLLWLGGALVVLSPVVHPWYVLWPLAAAMLTETWAWGVLASTVLLSYLVLQGYDPSQSSWTQLTWIPWIEYPPFFIALAWQALYKKPSLHSKLHPDESLSQSQMAPDPSKPLKR
ncbi:MAG: glycosyltransferase 87 family protein [Myxococcota bacterium]|nr:glycosyltransferase 87 family protein [Myxococcota bacterium]